VPRAPVGRCNKKNYRCNTRVRIVVVYLHFQQEFSYIMTTRLSGDEESRQLLLRTDRWNWYSVMGRGQATLTLEMGIRVRTNMVRSRMYAIQMKIPCYILVTCQSKLRLLCYCSSSSQSHVSKFSMNEFYNLRKRCVKISNMTGCYIPTKFIFSI